MQPKKLNPMWGGVFSQITSTALKNINQSITFDIRLAKYDVLGSKAHCKMLAKKQIITQAECQKIIHGLDIIAKKIATGKLKFDIQLEDIHMNIEYALTKIIGKTAEKLHTARSRNDQVATDLKLWLREAMDILDNHLQNIQITLVAKAQRYYNTIMPGFTHLQSAQPVTFGHHLLAYFEMFKRDRSRIKSARTRLNESPLGTAALAGTSFPIDRHMTAKELGFDRPTSNSLDSVSDRDFVLEYLSITAIIAIHLSRLAEEIILWCSQQFGFIKLSDAMSTGSSIMPQKRNPDAAELIRAKSGKIIGNLLNVLTVMKGLPLAYSKDMQEDKEPVFATHDTLSLAIPTLTALIQDISVDEQAMLTAATAGFSTATDIADWLVKNHGYSFRKAHKTSGTIVKLALQYKKNIQDLDLLTIQKIDPKITHDIYRIVTAQAAVANKTSFGGTAPKRVIQAINKAKRYLNGDKL